MNDKSRFFIGYPLPFWIFFLAVTLIFLFFKRTSPFLLRYLVCHYEKQERQREYSLVTNEEQKKMVASCYG
jgi:hypothetical protein